MKMARLVAKLGVLLAALGLASFAAADERILSYDSRITVERDGTLEVREEIRVRAEGDRIRRGIYRDFPTIYPGRDGRQIVVGFAFQAATLDGQVVPWRTESRGNGVRIYVGDPSSTVPRGEHTYLLIYRTDRQMGFFADHDELYWNVTGNGWGFVIDKASATVVLPEGIAPEEIKVEAYTGPQGAQGRDYTAAVQGATPTFATSRALRPGEGLTIVATWPKGHITAAVESSLASQAPQPMASHGGGYDPGPSSARDRYNSLAEAMLKRELPRNAAPLYVAGFGLALLLLYYYWIWDRVGRDPPGRVVIPEYEMPAKLSASSMRYILRMGYDDESFGAGVLSLAVKGYLRIEQDSKILGFGKKFTLVREPTPLGKPLNEDEKVLLASLFRRGDTLELEQTNHAVLRGARAAHEGALKRQFSSSFFKINGGWHALGVIFSLLFGFIAFALPGDAVFWPHWHFGTPLGWLTLALLLGGLVANGVYGKLLRAPTVVGQAAMDQIRGFKMYLEVAEGDEIRRVQGPPPPKLTPELFESYLPAALALGVEQKWAERFTRVLDIEAPNYRPTWYSGAGWNAANIGAFSSGLGSSLNSAISSASTAPGSKSGSGGGGSSGGGGGGGGGGGW
jgi:uncharacterized membrane protein YgcG